MQPAATTPPKWNVKGWHLFSILAGVVAILVLFYFNPAQNSFYPRCLFKSSTGLDCPGCGVLRATHQLLRGNLEAAWSLNPLWIVSLPLAGLLLLNQFVRSTRGKPLFRWKMPAYGMWLLFVLVLVFTIVRNLRYAPFS